MTEPEFSIEQNHPQKDNKLLVWLIVVIAVAAIVIPIYYYLNVEKPEQQKVKQQQQTVSEVVEVQEPVPETEPEVEPEIVPVELPSEEEVIEVAPVPEKVLPNLNESDNWLKEKLTELTWRKELLRLVIDDDMVRRLVVFTDNFAQGIVSYDYSPLISPNSKFSAIENRTPEGDSNWLWDESQTKRFGLYVDFLRSFEPEQLAAWYVELKPLIDEAYQELGYPEQNFTDTLQDAIVRVLDMEIPKEDIELIRPSVMYKFKSESLESMHETDKLLLRMGKENLLIIKSFLLEFSDALSRAEANN
ncbi:DUF3014 domain-containing protein [Thalassotalea sp. M1531]|uniref:DUF3014 domain-containing protein n=1 Tax=Thalassotalea algicola TaxID=2716224 RepID=A0A7Y0LFP0_9GAMM|nr:DUF3014 domain-containing protein [Thalassotalea algicola]NMP33359.1 DUF3014 domain-containing protein [Thalassotalea algicola]